MLTLASTTLARRDDLLRSLTVTRSPAGMRRQTSILASTAAPSGRSARTAPIAGKGPGGWWTRSGGRGLARPREIGIGACHRLRSRLILLHASRCAIYERKLI